MKLLLFNIFFTFLVIISCSKKNKESSDLLGHNKDSSQITNYTSQELLDYNLKIYKEEQKKILDYIKENNLKAESLKNGSFLVFKKKGEGTFADKGLATQISYKTNLIDGTKCYDSEKNGKKEFVVGRRTEIKGLDIAIETLREGDEVTLILPHYLAYGVKGDFVKIPMYATLVMDIKVEKVFIPDEIKKLDN